MTASNPSLAPNASLMVVGRFIGAIERGDLDALNACFAADAGIWHNTDQLWTTKAENAAAAAAFFEAFTSRTYRVERLEPLPGGALLLFVANLVKADGRTLDWPGCAIFEIEGDEIVRLKEYIDAASFAAAVG